MKILLGMSGGLDSTYAAAKLIGEGHQLVGAIVRMHEYSDIDGARRVADELSIPLVELDRREDFQREIVASFAFDYLSGRTPNPCVDCNAAVKFKALAEYADFNGFDRIATGHYAGVVKTSEGRYAVARSEDKTRDQSYVLWKLPQNILRVLMLPLGEITKKQVRENAKELGISSWDAPESREICFIPDNDYPTFIEKYFGTSPAGDFVAVDGRVLGRHKGILHYTIGQRRGLGISVGERTFVSDIDPDTHRITLAPDSHLYRSRVTVNSTVFSGLSPMKEGEVNLEVKLRYLAPPVPAKVFFSDGEAFVELSAPVRAPTPGQSAVFYRDNTVMFGGKIVKCQ